MQALASSASIEKLSLEKISAEELGELKSQLEKKSQDYPTVIQILKVLQKKLVTRDLLRQTMIGKLISGLNSIKVKPESEDEAAIIRELSLKLVEQWKKLSKKEKKESDKKESEETKESNGKQKTNGTSISNGARDVALYIPDLMKLMTGDRFRDPMRKKFVEILQTPIDKEEEEYDLEKKEKAAFLGVEIEECLNSKFKDQKAYSDKARSIVFNLKDPKNPNLRKKLLNRELTSWDLVTLDPKDLASEEQMKQREQSVTASMQARRTDWQLEEAKKSGSNVGFFTCKRCHTKNTTYYQMQTRGADEPMTNFVTCLDCTNRWKC